MGLFDFLKRKKKTGEAAPEADALLDLNDVDPAMIDPPETRYTQEYQDFLYASLSILVIRYERLCHNRQPSLIPLDLHWHKDCHTPLIIKL